MEVKRGQHVYLDGKVDHRVGAKLIGYYEVRWLEGNGMIGVESLESGKKYRIHESQIVQKKHEELNEPEPVVSGMVYRYPMTYDQPCQIDCRVTSCKFHKGAGKCENVSPAITLNENGKFVCWSQAER